MFYLGFWGDCAFKACLAGACLLLFNNEKYNFGNRICLICFLLTNNASKCLSDYADQISQTGLNACFCELQYFLSCLYKKKKKKLSSETSALKIFNLLNDLVLWNPWWENEWGVFFPIWDVIIYTDIFQHTHRKSSISKILRQLLGSVTVCDRVYLSHSCKI